MNGLWGLGTAELLDFVDTLATVVALYFTVITIRKNTRIIQNQSVNGLYKDFQELQLAILQNPETLKIIAEELEEKEKEVRKDSLASLLINNTYKAFRLQQRKRIPLDEWDLYERDMKELFKWQFIQDRWQEICPLFSPKFQLYISEHILSQPPK